MKVLYGENIVWQCIITNLQLRWGEMVAPHQVLTLGETWSATEGPLCLGSPGEGPAWQGSPGDVLSQCCKASD